MSYPGPWSRCVAAGILLATLLAAGCVHAPQNAPLNGAPAHAYRLTPRQPAKERQDLLLAVFFSGGGSRAAALSYGVLKTLHEARIGAVTGETSLLEQVDAISAVSGGAITAAYYCLFGDELFHGFEHTVLTHNIERDLILRALRPDNLYRLASPYYGRSDLAATYYDQEIFRRKTFGDLAQLPNRPFLIINATDMSTGARVGFTQASFDVIGSDLSAFPIGRAVAASTAVPLLLTPVTLHNYAANSPREQLGSRSSEAALSERFARMIEDLNSYRESPDRRYVHLVDGGVADNLGIRAMQEFTMLNGGLVSSLQRLNLSRVTKVAVIVVDASVRFDGAWDKREATPGTLGVMKAISQSVLSRGNYETTDLFRRSMELWQQQLREERHRTADGGELPELGFYFIRLNFAAADPEERKFFYNVRTDLSLSRAAAGKIIAAAGTLLRENAEYQRLLHDLSSETARSL